MIIFKLKYFVLLLLLVISSCDTYSDTSSSDDTNNAEPISIVKPSIQKPDIAVTHQDSIYTGGLILLNDASANRVYLIDKNEDIIHEWPLKEKRLGNDCFLLPNGQLLSMLEDENAQLKFGGFGGIIQLLGKDGEIQWNFKYSGKDFIAHHDAEILPNGNILFQVWERKSAEEAANAGYSSNSELISDAIFEINPITNLIVWQWHAWDHLVQSYDSSKNNFGDIRDNPQLVNLNYNSNNDGDIMHANGIAYDSVKDVIYLSVNFYSEIWVIDHSCTSEEAASHLGGNYGKGGDLIYRFGNPEAYNHTLGIRMFDHQHHPSLLKGPDLGNMLIFSNGFSQKQSTVYELQIPKNFELNTNKNNEPKITWSFTHPNLYAPKVSGAVRLPNGNTLITEGDYGLWEVTKDKQVVWKYEEKGFFWRGYHYENNSEAIQNLNITSLTD